MRVAAEIALTAKERQVLERHVASRSASVRLAQRSPIVLLAAQGYANREIAQQLGTDPNKAGRCRLRYVEGGMEALWRVVRSFARLGVARLLRVVPDLDEQQHDLTWFTEHCFLEDGYLPFGTDICLMPLNHPVPLA